MSLISYHSTTCPVLSQGPRVHHLMVTTNQAELHVSLLLSHKTPILLLAVLVHPSWPRSVHSSTPVTRAILPRLCDPRDKPCSCTQGLKCPFFHPCGVCISVHTLQSIVGLISTKNSEHFLNILNG